MTIYYTVFTRDKKTNIVRWMVKKLAVDHARKLCAQIKNSTSAWWEFTTDSNYIASYGRGQQWPPKNRKIR